MENNFVSVWRPEDDDVKVELKTSIAVVFAATGQYIKFAPGLIKSLRKYFCLGQHLTIIVLTDSTEPLEGADIFPAPHRSWPEATLLRYESIIENEGFFSSFDYLYHMDADLCCVETIPFEDIQGDLVATISPVGYDWPVENLPFERNGNSKAYVPSGQGEVYFTGSLLGGRSDIVLQALKVCLQNIEIDKANGLMARLHEESHWNRYLFHNPPTKVLSPEYCCPDKSSIRPLYKRRLILTLDKPALDGLKSKGEL